MKPLAYLGFIKKPHGFKGVVKLQIENSELSLKETEPLMLEINKKPVPFFIEQISKQGNEWQVKFEDIHSVDEAEEITGLSVFVETDEEFQDDIPVNHAIGFTLHDIHLGDIGIVTNHIERPSQDILEVKGREKTFLVPFVREFITGFDHKKQILYTHLPEGLMDIND